MSSLGYERMFWKSEAPNRVHLCLVCHSLFDSFTELYSHKELWHGKPILKLNGITTVDELPSEHQTKRKLAKELHEHK